MTGSVDILLNDNQSGILDISPSPNNIQMSSTDSVQIES
jgi:hypothetical protein